MASNRDSSGNDNYPARSLDPEQPVISVVPLNSVPYTGPLRPITSNSSSQTFNNSFSSPTVDQPAMVFLPTHSSHEDLERAVAATRHGVAVTGSAALGKVGRPIGSIDISELKDSYLFRVALPGVDRDNETFSWYIEPNGSLFIKGVTTTGKKELHRHGMVFQMLTENLSPPGDFSISFQLPGPIDPEGIQANFRTDGIFEGLVKKAQP